MSLTDTTIKNAKPGDKTARLFDGGGLYLEIAPAGASGGGSSTAMTARKNGHPFASNQKRSLT